MRRPALLVLLAACTPPAASLAAGDGSSPPSAVSLSPASATAQGPGAAATSAAPLASAPAASASAPLAAASSAPAEGSADKAPEAPPGMALVPAGEFTMGANDEGEMDERPAHKVTIKAFYLDLTEVTNEDYSKCVDKGVCRPHDKSNAKANKVGDDSSFRKPRQPISAISWDDSQTYCKWLGKRLPTEAEWEKAARGPDGRIYPWGNDKPTHDHGVWGAGTTAEVGSKPRGKGPYGHLDLTGNVWEWVDDFYDPYAYKRPGAAQGVHGTCEQTMEAFTELRRLKMQGFTGSNPIPTECEKVLRGGAFNYHARGLRASNRVHHPGRFRLIMSGFRCAKDAP